MSLNFPWRSNSQLSTSDSGNGLVTNRPQAIPWSNADPDLPRYVVSHNLPNMFIVHFRNTSIQKYQPLRIEISQILIEIGSNMELFFATDAS